MQIILFIVSITASALGAIAGFGGGVIIKPVLDAIGVLPVSTISFLSGCTVLCMSVSSLIKSRNNGIKLNIKTSTPLAIGSVLGGVAGKILFQYVRDHFANEDLLGFIQATVLVSLMILVFVYIIRKDRLLHLHVEHFAVCLAIGAFLGIISSFLGIGGGPNNVAILFFFFSMDAKEAAKNSIYLIMFSQLASLILTIIDGTVPQFEWSSLICMAAGGIGGGLIGSFISKRIESRLVERLLMLCLILVIMTNLFNMIKFGCRIM